MYLPMSQQTCRLQDAEYRTCEHGELALEGALAEE